MAEGGVELINARLMDTRACSIYFSSFSFSPDANLPRYDMTAWFEIRELAPSGEYLPVPCDYGDSAEVRGTFLLRQGANSETIIFCVLLGAIN